MKAKALKPESTSSAVVVDGKLILTLLEAVTPVVWQMELEDTKSSALEVLEDKQRNLFTLVLRDTKGGSTEIAPFEQKAQAVDALMRTSQALHQGHGKIRASVSASLPHQNIQELHPYSAIASKEQKSNKLGAFLAVALVIILMLVWVMSIPRGDGVTRAEKRQAEAASSAGAAPSGVPVSADDFLSGQQ